MAARPRVLPRVLVGYIHYPGMLSYFNDWLEAFGAEPTIDVVPTNLATPWGRRRLARHVADVDLVVLLHSVVGDSLTEIRRHGTPLLDRRSPLVAFVSNEVSLPTQPFAEKLEVLASLDAQFVASQLLIDTSRRLYASLDAEVLAMPHALNPHAFRSEVAQASRPIDVGFRGARYLPHVGDDQRNRIIDYFATQRFEPPIVTDVRTNISYGRRRWARFLNRCKATIGAEAGAVEITPDDAILGRTEEALGVGSADLRLRARLRPVHRYFPRSAKNVLRSTAERLAGRTKPAAAPVGTPSVVIGDEKMSGKCLSSRHFDAIGTETCQILLPGRYNDVFVADQHYLALEPDFSNIDDVMARFHDETARSTLVRETRGWALEEHTYAHRVRSLLAHVGLS
ncbi:MAG: hypothetical protein FJW86_13765 [Actinobacteria bacterium]|nr:hypothetical protein [Actinomycetota bacterium]